jgi:AcrR family transcriptional regulator
MSAAVITYTESMARWEPGTAARLQHAALELFSERGYEQVTAAEIAESAGLTQRTFFRYFSDKRDVLFAGQDTFVEAFLAGAAAAPHDAPPMRVVAAAINGAAAFFTDERRPFSRARQSVIEQNPALQERERHKLAQTAVELGRALRARGIGEPAATLAAESGVTVFSIAFLQWLQPDERRPFTSIAAATLDEFLALGRPDR